jgi:large subunit ribosomal protein L15
VVSVAALGALFPNGGEVSIEDLVAAGAVRKNQPVKILGNGDISVALQVSANAFSQSAREKLTAAGGAAVEV